MSNKQKTKYISNEQIQPNEISINDQSFKNDSINNSTLELQQKSIDTKSKNNPIQYQQAPYPFLNICSTDQPRKISDNKIPLSQKTKKIPCIQILFPQIKLRSFISLVCLADVIIYITMILINKSKNEKMPCILYKFQGTFLPDIRFRWNLQRLLVPVFLSGGWIHLITNIYGLMSNGYMAQSYFGWKIILITFITSCWCGNCLAAFVNKYKVTANISSFTYGIFALVISMIIQNYKQLGNKKKYTLSMFGLIFLINFIGIWDSNYVTIYGIIGGFSNGILIGFHQLISKFQLQNQLKQVLKTQSGKRYIFSKYLVILLILGLNLGLFIACMTKKFDDIEFLENVSCYNKL